MNTLNTTRLIAAAAALCATLTLFQSVAGLASPQGAIQAKAPVPAAVLVAQR